jgi:hypothetical protein
MPCKKDSRFRYRSAIEIARVWPVGSVHRRRIVNHVVPVTVTVSVANSVHESLPDW